MAPRTYFACQIFLYLCCNYVFLFFSPSRLQASEGRDCLIHFWILSAQLCLAENGYLLNVY